jgi:hypothetical protein
MPTWPVRSCAARRRLLSRLLLAGSVGVFAGDNLFAQAPILPPPAALEQVTEPAKNEPAKIEPDKNAQGETQTAQAKNDEPAKEPAPPVEVAAAPPVWKESAEKILAIGELKEANSAERAAATAQLEQLRPGPAGDPHLHHAQVLVAMHFEKWSAALALADTLVNQYPEYSPGRVAKARILMKLNKFPQAAVELETLAEKLSIISPAVSPEQRLASARFLGLGVGFFAGPGKDLLKPTQYADLESASHKLPNDLKFEFQQSFTIITTEYRVMIEEGEAALEKHRAKLLGETQAMQQDLEAARNQFKADAAAAKQDLETRWAQAQSQWQLAWNAAQNALVASRQLRTQQALLEGNLATIPPPRIDDNGYVDRRDERRYLDTVAQLRNSIFNLEQQRISLAVRIDQAQTQGMLLERQMALLQNQSQVLGVQLLRQNESFAKITDSIRDKELAAQRATPKKTATQQRSEKAFKTYDDFNFHKEKKLLLQE